MNAIAESTELFLVQLAELNISIWVEGESLRINAPAGVLNDAIKSKLRDSKSELISLLKKSNTVEEKNEWPTITADRENMLVPFPLSDVQHAYWVGRNKGIEFGNVATHYYYELNCRSLDLARFNRGLCQLIERHEMLRAIVNDDGQQVILQDVEYKIPTFDLSGYSEVKKERELLSIREEMSHQVMPADKWPLFDIRAAVLGDDLIRLYFSWDFINLDAWSIYALCREWNLLYENPHAQLAPIEICYRDYVLAERNLRYSAMYLRDKEYWWEKLDRIPDAPILPISSNIDVTRQHKFTRRRFRLNNEQWNKLKSKSARLGITPSCLLLSAFSEVLALWSKQPHFTLNMTFFNRLPMHPDVYKLVGDFTSLTLLEVDLRIAKPFKQRAADIQRQFMQDFQHHLVSGVEVMREWSKRKGYSLQAAMPVVFTSCLVLNSAEGDDAGLIESFGELIYGISQTPQVWLDNQVMEDKHGLVFNWDAVEEVFPSGVLDAMFSAYGKLLENLAEGDDAWDSVNPIKIPANQLQKRSLINNTFADTAKQYLHQGFVINAHQNPSAVAVETSELRLTYGQLLARAIDCAKMLARQQFAQGDIVAVVMDKSVEQVVATLGILMAGGAYLPIDIDLPLARQQQIIEQSRCKILVTKLQFSERLKPLGAAAVIEIDVTKNVDNSLNPPRLQINTSDLAYVIFTSGSTGVPKGVMISHEAAVNTLTHVSSLYGITAADKVLAVSSLSFDLSVYDIFGVLAAGGTLVIPDAKLSNAPEHWLDLINQHQISIWNSAPPLMSMLLGYMEGFSKNPNNYLRMVLLSGDWIPLDLKAKLDACFPQSQLISMGGATEASVWSIYHRVEKIDSSLKSIPYGIPLPNQTMHVLNSFLEDCPEHVTGRIFIGGNGLALGYLFDEEKTRAQFITHPVTGTRLYCTGDLGRYLPDGNIEFLGREDSQVKLRGHRIELGEISSVLRSHPGIKDAVAVIDGDSRKDQKLWVYLTLNAKHADPIITMKFSDESILRTPSSIKFQIREDEQNHPARKISEEEIGLWQDLDNLYAEAVIHLFEKENIFSSPDAISSQTIAEKIVLAPRYQRWLERALNTLVAKKILKSERGLYSKVSSSLPANRLGEYCGLVNSGLQTVLGLTEREAMWFTIGASSLHDILQEKTHSAELYTADETAIIYQKLFPDSHHQLENVFENLVSSSSRKLKVFEVGSGLGSATQHLLPVLRNHCESYQFTDISNYFLKRAKDKFVDYPFMEYGIFNLDHNPAQQGFEQHHYDVVVASSVLHDVSDVKRTLKNLYKLMVPGGLLVLLEETRFIRSFDLTMGLQQGFDVFTDTELRQEHPLLSRQKWEEVCKSTGFTDIQVMSIEGSVAEYLGFDVFVAQMPKVVECLNEEAVDEFILEKLPAYMRPNGYMQIENIPLNSNGKIDYKSLVKPAHKKAQSILNNTSVSSTEQKLIGIWSDVLGNTDFGINSSFFDVGGDSLLLVEIRNKIKQQMERQVATTVLFEHPTISALAKFLDGDEQSYVNTDTIEEHAKRQRKAMQKNKMTKVGAA